MDYMIEDAHVLSDEGRIIRSFLIKNQKISHFGKSLNHYNVMKMNVSSFYMTPGHVMFDFHLLTCHHLKQFKKQQRKLITKGCTTVLLPSFVRYESEISQKIRVARHTMINSTIDFVIGLHLPAEKLHPNMIRVCKKHHLPFIVIEISERTNLEYKPWGWIKEAQFQYPIPIYPIWKIEDAKVLLKKKDVWKKIIKAHRFPSYLQFPFPYTPLPKVMRQQIGIYPIKGELLTSSDLDYNLYKDVDSFQVEDVHSFDYDKMEPNITVHRGKIIRVEKRLHFFPGYGQELHIKIPGRFASIDHNANCWF